MENEVKGSKDGRRETKEGTDRVTIRTKNKRNGVKDVK
jgi:hypothetical protein